MLAFMWVHYHPAQLGLSEFTLDDITSHGGGGEWITVRVYFIARLKESTDTCSCTYTLPFTHICSNIKSLHNLCSHVLCADFMYQHVCWFLHRHANMLTCHCNAYDACLWRWKLAFSVVVSLIGGEDTDCKSCWSEYNGFVLQWLWYHIIASACSQTHTQLVYQTPAA